MLLAVDIGNTNIVLGGLEGDDIRFVARMATDRQKTEDQYAAELGSVLHLYCPQPEKMEGAVISSVVPQALGAVRGAVHRITGKKPLVVGPGVKTGLNIAIEDPSSIGADLIVCAVAALAEYRSDRPLVVVDMGTATTFTVVNEKGTFLGGSICPGLVASLNALSTRASALPEVSLEGKLKLIGRSTTECMRSGALYGHAAMVDGVVQRMEEELGCLVTVVATGGVARFVVPLCKREILYDEQLLLKGCGLIYRKNQPQR